MDKIKNDIEKVTGEILNTEKMKDSLCNEVYLITTNNGKFIVKIANNELRQKELDIEYQIIKKLNMTLNLPNILVYKKGKSLSYFIMEYIIGDKPKKFTDDVLQLMGKTLKKIHNTTKSNRFVDFDKLINIAEENMKMGRLDLNEFKEDGKEVDPRVVLTFLKNNKPNAKACLLHGDYRPKNMIIKKDKLFILDWGLSFMGDPYYDLSIIKYYFTDEEFNKFLKYYGIKELDKNRLIYNEKLSAFLNV